MSDKVSDERRIFAARLNFYMNLHGKTQSDLIRELGINKSTVSTWCNGTKMPRMGTIQTLADYFGIMKSDLIEEHGANSGVVYTEMIPAGLSPEKREFTEMVLQLNDNRFNLVYDIVSRVLSEQEKEPD